MPTSTTLAATRTSAPVEGTDGAGPSGTQHKGFSIGAHLVVLFGIQILLVFALIVSAAVRDTNIGQRRATGVAATNARLAAEALGKSVSTSMETLGAQAALPGYATTFA